MLDWLRKKRSNFLCPAANLENLMHFENVKPMSGSSKSDFFSVMRRSSTVYTVLSVGYICPKRTLQFILFDEVGYFGGKIYILTVVYKRAFDADAAPKKQKIKKFILEYLYWYENLIL